MDEPLSLSQSVSLRPEPFGALAYNFGNRRLTFLKRPELVAVMRGLDGVRPLRTVLDDCGIPAGQWPVFEESLERLIVAEMIERPALAGAHD